MDAYSVEQSIQGTDQAYQDLLQFVREHAADTEAHEAERGIFQRLIPLGLAAMKLYFAEKGTGDVGAVWRDPATGEELPRERREPRKRDYFSLFGKLEVPRTYYRTEGRPGVMPLDAAANLPEQCYSYLLQEWASDFAIRGTFDEVVHDMSKWFGYTLPKRSVETFTEKSAVDYEAFYESRSTPPQAEPGQIMAVGFDGKGVPVVKAEAAEIKARPGRGEKRQKKREALVGVAYVTDPKERTPEAVTDRLMKVEEKKQKQAKEDQGAEPQARDVPKRYLASLKRSKQEVMEDIRAEALKRDPEGRCQRVVLVDGARGLWTLVKALFVGWVAILDIIHVVEKLWKVAYLYHAEGSKEAWAWVYDHLLSVLRGRVGRVIGGLKGSLVKGNWTKKQRKVLEGTIRYFTRNRKAMRYDEYLACGLPIATGVVESACGHLVKNRMEGAGMRWTRTGAEGVLLLRSVRASKDWEAYWRDHTRRQKLKLYGPLQDESDEEMYDAAA